ncbi:DUF3606 domain-containing protein [Roseomonas sp. SSH11]|uniref:DUF3606 domain-containing protein n=1 Tax=Pararoseomonas baculiformis TaxID=2820812 RepID=A0ABS4ALW0_9PROT|nr:DUF3606 domain-containing protein [Pararoseomonas baculiformis]
MGSKLPSDRDIQLADPYELQHWAKLFGVTERELVSAIQAAGPQVRNIAHQLQIVPNIR